MMIRRTLPRRPAGFTMIELIVTVAILGIMASIAAPSFKDLMLGQRIKSASFDVTAALMLARSEALKQNGSVTLTPSSGSSEWAGGWTVTGPDGTTLSTQGAYDPSITIAGPASIAYTRSGRSSSAATVTLQVASSASGSTVSPRCISVGVTGQPKSVMGSC
jgi:type IV fimbrial biogenesis protein FimT